MSKNEGGKYISRSHKVTTNYFCNVGKISESITLMQIHLKKKHSLIIVFLTYSNRIERIPISRKCSIITWQSCVFKLFNLRSFIKTKIFIFFYLYFFYFIYTKIIKQNIFF